ncbi:hypothetical protein CYMTET_15030 [Cymbomonas tetramitiformis]|uniref:TTI1 N-terminal TPR domain-containing protein n=1 Tax=Cymbomonas tetramitiformis TaxID=36881 RepID=A0AAE0GEU0_9CHLO|nr:hypothetical protein CYMTET_15030 [Cymbomonas tetramitiformis]
MDSVEKTDTALAFAQLQPHCAPLLELAQDRVALSEALDALLLALPHVPLSGLTACTEYVLFPNMMLLDAWVSWRLEGATRGPSSMPVEATKSLRVGERALACTEALLARCGCDSSQQMMAVIQRMVAVIVVPREKSSEEIRQMALRSIRHVLPGDPERGQRGAGRGQPGGEMSRAAVLRSVEIAPQIGHLISVLIQVAEEEVAAGLIGSRALRADALFTLSRLLAAVGSADALAFFLPGIVRGSGGGAARASASGALAALDALASSTRGSSSPTTSQHMNQHSSPVSDASALGRAPSEPPTEPASTFRVHRDAKWLEQVVCHLQPLLEGTLPKLCGHQQSAVRAAIASLADGVMRHCTRSMGACIEMLLETLLSLSLDEAPSVASLALGSLQSVSIAGDAPRSTCSTDGAARSVVSVTWETVESVLQRQIRGLPSAVTRGAVPVDLQCRRLVAALRLAGGAGLQGRVLGDPAARTRLCSVLRRCFAFLPSNALVVATGWHHGTVSGGGSMLEYGHGRHSEAAVLAGLGNRRAASRLLAAAPATSQSNCSPAKSPSQGYELAAQPLSGGPEAASSIAFTGAADTDQVLGEETGGAVQAEEARERLGSGAEVDAGGEDGGGKREEGDGRPHVRVLAKGETLPQMPPQLAELTSPDMYLACASVCRELGDMASRRTCTSSAAAATGGGEGYPALAAVMAELLQAIRQAGLGGAGGVSAVGLRRAREHQAASRRADGWQRQAAAAAVALNEIMKGAALRAGAADGSLSMAGQVDLLPLAVTMAQDYLSPEWWDLPTTTDGGRGAVAGSESGREALPSFSQLNDNALLIQILIEGFGVLAEALKERFTRNVALLPAVMYPLLERLGDPHPLVSSAAARTLRCIALHCCYGTLEALIVANGDYLVESLCRQLRHIHAHPHAPHLFAAILRHTVRHIDAHPHVPHLFAAILRHTGAAMHLLPVLCEPANKVIAGLSVLSRHRHPAHTATFLASLLEIADAGARLAAEAATAAQAAVGTLEAQAAGSMRQGEESEVQATVSMAEVREYFERRRREHEDKSEDEGEEAEPAVIQEEDEAEKRDPDAGRGRGLGAESRGRGAEEEDRTVRRRLRAAMKLADAAGEAAAPLMASVEMRTQLLALEVATVALRALRSAVTMTECEETLARSSAHPGEVPPESAPGDELPKLLPRVHATWLPLIGCLSSSSVPVLERAQLALGFPPLPFFLLHGLHNLLESAVPADLFGVKHDCLGLV